MRGASKFPPIQLKINQSPHPYLCGNSPVFHLLSALGAILSAALVCYAGCVRTRGINLFLSRSQRGHAIIHYNGVSVNICRARFLFSVSAGACVLCVSVCALFRPWIIGRRVIILCFFRPVRRCGVISIYTHPQTKPAQLCPLIWIMHRTLHLAAGIICAGALEGVKSTGLYTNLWCWTTKVA